VDYAAHIGHGFLHVTGTREDRAIATLGRVGIGVFNGGFSTMLASVVLAAATTYIFEMFFKCYFLCAVLGLGHGMLLLPALLSIFGPETVFVVGDKGYKKSMRLLPELTSSLLPGTEASSTLRSGTSKSRKSQLVLLRSKTGLTAQPSFFGIKSRKSTFGLRKNTFGLKNPGSEVRESIALFRGLQTELLIDLEDVDEEPSFNDLSEAGSRTPSGLQIPKEKSHGASIEILELKNISMTSPIRQTEIRKNSKGGSVDIVQPTIISLSGSPIEETQNTRGSVDILQPKVIPLSGSPIQETQKKRESVEVLSLSEMKTGPLPLSGSPKQPDMARFDSVKI